MTFADLHTRAIVPIPFVVCGIDMLPLTIGHARILESLGLWGAFLPSEVMSAALICCRPWQAYRPALTSRWYPLALRFKLWRWRLGRRWNWIASSKAWREYVAHHREEPVWSMSGEGGTMTMPMLASIRVSLCAKVGYRPETFDDVHFAQAVLDYYAFCELDGRATITALTPSQLHEMAKEAHA